MIIDKPKFDNFFNTLQKNMTEIANERFKNIRELNDFDGTNALQMSNNRINHLYEELHEIQVKVDEEIKRNDILWRLFG